MHAVEVDMLVLGVLFGPYFIEVGLVAFGLGIGSGALIILGELEVPDIHFLCLYAQGWNNLNNANRKRRGSNS
jgi:hypothetical protein